MVELYLDITSHFVGLLHRMTGHSRSKPYMSFELLECEAEPSYCAENNSTLPPYIILPYLGNVTHGKCMLP